MTRSALWSDRNRGTDGVRFASKTMLVNWVTARHARKKKLVKITEVLDVLLYYVYSARLTVPIFTAVLRTCVYLLGTPSSISYCRVPRFRIANGHAELFFFF